MESKEGALSLNIQRPSEIEHGVAMDELAAASNAAETQDDPRTPTRASSKTDQLRKVEYNKAEEREKHTTFPSKTRWRTVDVETEHDSAVDASGASSTDIDLDRPLVNKTMIPLQRGDSASSDSSVSGLSRASSSSSVYATPFRMTPFRTPAGTGRTGNVAGTGPGERTSYFSNPPPARFGSRGGATGSRASFSSSGQVRSSAPSNSPNANLSSTRYAPVHAAGGEAAREQDEPVASNNAGLSKHWSRDSTATIGPSPAAAFAAEASGRITVTSSTSNGLGSASAGPGTGLHLRSPPSPAVEATSLPVIAGLRPPRPGLGSRTASIASIGINMHKRAIDFDLGEVLGEGSYSTVFLATDKYPPHRQYALKVLDKKHIIKVTSL